MAAFLMNLVIMIVTSVFLWEAYNIDIPKRFAGSITPAFWPRVLLWGLMALTILSCVSAWIKRKEADTTGSEDENGRDLLGLIPINLIPVCLLLAIYCLSIQYIGMLLSSIIFLTVLSYSMGQKNVFKGLVLSISLSVAGTWVFGYLLRIPLPRGISFFRQLSDLFY